MSSRASGRTSRWGSLWATPLVLTSVVAGLCYSNFVLDWVLRGFEGMTIVVSVLSAPGQPHAAVVRTTDFVCGVLVLTLLPWVRRALPPGPLRKVVLGGTAVFAIGAAAAAVVTTPCGPGEVCRAPEQLRQGGFHNFASAVSDIGLYLGTVAAWLATRRTGPRWFNQAAWWLFWVAGVIATSFFGLLALTGPDWAAAASQRVHIVGMSLWIVCLGMFAAGRVRGVPGSGDRDAAGQPPHRAERREGT